MKLQYKKHRFRLISPIVGNKIYVTSSLKHGAKKCSTELNKNKYNEFSIIDIDTFHTYRFVINKKKTQCEDYIIKNPDSSNIENKINQLENRLTIAENRINELLSK